MRKNELNLIVNFSCYAVAMVAVLAVVIAIAKPSVPVMTEQESTRIELQQAVNQAGLNGLVEIE
jgi:hypothetical protein